MQKVLILIGVVFISFSFSAQTCTKEIVYGRDYYTTPKKAYFQADRTEMMESIQKALEQQGYEVQNIDESKGRVTSGWRAVEVDSHYFDLFGRKDYGSSDGAYYQVMVDLMEEGAQTKILVSTKVKTIVGKLESSGKVERRLLETIEDFLRPPQIELTNVGVRKK